MNPSGRLPLDSAATSSGAGSNWAYLGYTNAMWLVQAYREDLINLDELRARMPVLEPDRPVSEPPKIRNPPPSKTVKKCYRRG